MNKIIKKYADPARQSPLYRSLVLGAAYEVTRSVAQTQAKAEAEACQVAVYPGSRFL
ncbi:MAG: hypothetical protein ACLR2O_07480 [Coprococcus sp.]